MPDRLLICTDLDRTLIPNGPQEESADARPLFSQLVARDEVTLAYVSGRDKQLVQQAIEEFQLPVPDYVIGDVGSSIYHINSDGQWLKKDNWDQQIATDWANHSHADLHTMLADIKQLQLQEVSKQSAFKLSFYVPLETDQELLKAVIEQRMQAADIKARQIWSIDEPAKIGLLDILPAGASKYHAIEAIMKMQKFHYDSTVFCGDSGNDLEVLASPIAAVLVANSQPEVQQQARQLSEDSGFADRLYLAKGRLPGLNGNYSAGMLEGIFHYFPDVRNWLAHIPPLPPGEGAVPGINS